MDYFFPYASNSQRNSTSTQHFLKLQSRSFSYACEASRDIEVITALYNIPKPAATDPVQTMDSNSEERLDAFQRAINGLKLCPNRVKAVIREALPKFLLQKLNGNGNYADENKHEGYMFDFRNTRSATL